MVDKFLKDFLIELELSLSSIDLIGHRAQSNQKGFLKGE